MLYTAIFHADHGVRFHEEIEVEANNELDALRKAQSILLENEEYHNTFGNEILRTDYWEVFIK